MQHIYKHLHLRIEHQQLEWSSLRHIALILRQFKLKSKETRALSLTHIPKALDFSYVQTITAHAHFDWGGGGRAGRKTKKKHYTWRNNLICALPHNPSISTGRLSFPIHLKYTVLNWDKFWTGRNFQGSFSNDKIWVTFYHQKS
jgi:hypothetical protein